VPLRRLRTRCLDMRVEIHLSRHPVPERLVGPLVIVERQVAAQARACLPWASIRVGVDLVILDRTPQALNEDIIADPAFAIHADPHVGRPQELALLRAGEGAPLVAVPDLRRRLHQRLLHGGEHEGHCSVTSSSHLTT
jgi:hypothetical protein